MGIRERKPLPGVVGICPVHSAEFYVPHGGKCPEPECDERLVEYEPADHQAGAVAPDRLIARIMSLGGFERVEGGEFWIARDNVLALIEEELGPEPTRGGRRRR